MNLEEILNQVEEMRRTLNEKSLKDPDVLEISQRLDKLLNKYQKMLQRKITK